MDSWNMLLQIILLLLACLLAGSLMSALKQSPLVGYLLAGMVMGHPGLRRRTGCDDVDFGSVGMSAVGASINHIRRHWSDDLPEQHRCGSASARGPRGNGFTFRTQLTGGVAGSGYGRCAIGNPDSIAG